MSDLSTQQQTSPEAQHWYESPVAQGAAIGAGVGSFVLPGLGTLAGGALGAFGGSIFGGLFDGPAPVPEARTGVAKAAEEAKKAVTSAPAGPAPKDANLSAEAATQAIDKSYGAGANGALPYKNEKIGDLAKMSKEDRMALLGKITQNGGKDSESFCGPTALIAAAIYGGGAEGLTGLIGQLQKDGGKGDQASLKKLLESTQKGQLDMKGIHDLEGLLFKDMQKRQQDFLLAGVGGFDGMSPAEQQKVRDRVAKQARENGTSNESMSKFIKDAGLGKLFFDEKGNQTMSLNALSNNAKNMDASHWVLNIDTGNAKDGPTYKGYGGTANAVFDPWNRGGNAGQVTTGASNEELLKAYLSNSKSGVEIQR